MANHDTQVLKGILSMLLLRVLAEHEDYGYSVVTRLQALGFDDLAEGTVYPALTRLEGKGLLRSRLVPSDSGPARKYYRPTAQGELELARTTESWQELRSNVDRVLGVDVVPTVLETPSEPSAPGRTSQEVSS